MYWMIRFWWVLSSWRDARGADVLQAGSNQRAKLAEPVGGRGAKEGLEAIELDQGTG